jgi:pyruvate kinase
MKRTKIVCTIGPASNKESMLSSMMKAGMDVARLNFSHGTHEGHAKLLRLVRRTAKKLNKPIAIIGDLQGPKIRLGVLPETGVSIPTGSSVVFSTSTSAYKDGIIPVTYANLHKDVKAGHRLLIDDGLLEAEVTKVVGKNIHAKMINGGMVTSHKGMNFPDSTLKVSSLTQKDRDDVKFGVEQEVDWMALSFVTSAEDVKLLRQLIKAAAKPNQVLPRIIVKIEKHEAIERFDEIMKATDAVMVARGDLGVEIPAEEVPIRQKEIIEKCREAGKPVVVATQMLDSMIRNPRPTRAEVSDVANAVFDHTDGVMLSGESASGKYPLAAVKMMAQIIKEAEGSVFVHVPLSVEPPTDQPASVAHAIKLLAIQKSVDGVLVSQELAPWSETVLRSHPEIPLFMAVPNKGLEQQTVLRWGAIPFVLKNANEKTFVKLALAELKKRKWIKKRMKLAVVMGGTHGEGFDHIGV